MKQPPKIIEVEKTGRWLFSEQKFLIDVCGKYIKTGPKSVITCSFCGCRIAGLSSYQIPERCPNCNTKMVNYDEINHMRQMQKEIGESEEDRIRGA